MFFHPYLRIFKKNIKIPLYKNNKIKFVNYFIRKLFPLKELTHHGKKNKYK
jgi:hypothetical protein